MHANYHQHKYLPLLQINLGKTHCGLNIYLLELLGLYFAAAFTILAMGPGLFAIDELLVRRFSPELELEQSGSVDTVVSDGVA